jgi:uncharacterized phage protein (predicted DNA packaging)
MLNNFNAAKKMETLISLDDLKHHLAIEQGFMDDDVYLDGLIHAAQEAVEKAINRRLTDCEPETVLLSIKILAATWYANREGVSFGSPNKIPYTFDFLIGLNKNYNDCRGITD